MHSLSLKEGSVLKQRDLGCRNGPAVDNVITAVNRGRAIGRKEGYQLCDLFRAARSTDGNAADHVHNHLTRSILVDSSALGQLYNHAVRTGSLNKARRNKIDPHSFGTDFVRRPFAVGAERCF
jgi:hypothetical protein